MRRPSEIEVYCSSTKHIEVAQQIIEKFEKDKRGLLQLNKAY
jgi:hypothetical protein